jgi:hypothetical protein
MLSDQFAGTLEFRPHRLWILPFILSLAVVPKPGLASRDSELAAGVETLRIESNPAEAGQRFKRNTHLVLIIVNRKVPTGCAGAVPARGLENILPPAAPHYPPASGFAHRHQWIDSELGKNSA